MTFEKARHRRGYHWVLAECACYQTSIIGREAVTEYVSLLNDGRIYLKERYATDGITGITGKLWEKLFTRSWLENRSYPHDGIYQLIRLGLIPAFCKINADDDLKKGCIKDGAYIWMAHLVWKMVDKYGGKAIDSKYNRPIIEIP